jgi:hypothetical protein
MAEREVVLDQDDTQDALQQATARAEQAEAELAKLKKHAGSTAEKAPATGSTPATDGGAELRKDSMMAHLLDSLAAGQDIGHYGRLVFAMVARHFMSDEEVLSWLAHDKDFGESEARLMLRQVEGRDYNPPKRDRILEWQAQQEFPIIPDPEDPDCGNLYRNLKFPDAIYHHIEHYQEQKISSEQTED